MGEATSLDKARMMGYATQPQVKSVDRRHIYSDLENSINAAQADGVSYVVGEDDLNEYGWELIGVKPGDRINPVSPDDFRNFIQSLGDRKEQVIGYIAERLDNYEQFKDVVHEFLDQVNELDDHREHPAHIAQDVFNVVIGGQDYVLRHRPNAGDVAQYLVGTSFIDGVDHFEQIVAASVEDGVTIARKVPGKTVNRLAPEILVNASDEHLSQCFDDLLIAWQRGLPMENKSKNILYDEENGFGFIDFTTTFNHIKDDKDISQKSLFDNYFKPVFFSIVNNAITGEDWKPKTRESIQKNLEFYQKKVGLMKGLAQIVLPKLADKEEALSLLTARIQEDLDFYSNKIMEHSDEEWIDTTLRQNNE